ncbi:three-Cys-motif partner protein TcmP [Oceaniglobus trochenteri]|uniref:three-Cys-motif partner protein TcmP n=1 Tax=Oceaniglobus trochenteri TaxID=2763260 RepID=UPI00315A0EB3
MSKSKLIAGYLAKYQFVTKGGLYIDGFAAPQKRDDETAWTARRVLEINPPRIRRLWLCDNDPKGLLQLRRLKAAHHRKPAFRHVSIMEGDFNETVKTILMAGRMYKRTPVFALLDQRTAECHWSTVQLLARKAGVRKIELMYFLGTSWIHRSLTQSRTPARTTQLDKWWGGDTWRSLVELTQQDLALHVANRFIKELGYSYVKPYPILQRDGEKKVAFYLIHASDHPDAPKLMGRAYLDVVGDIARSPVDSQRNWLDDPAP